MLKWKAMLACRIKVALPIAKCTEDKELLFFLSEFYVHTHSGIMVDATHKRIWCPLFSRVLPLLTPYLSLLPFIMISKGTRIFGICLFSSVWSLESRRQASRPLFPSSASPLMFHNHLRGGALQDPFIEINPNYVSNSHAHSDSDSLSLESSRQGLLCGEKTFPLLFSPTLSIGTASCILLWLLWQRQQAQIFLSRNFVCSHRNVRQGRHYTTLSSAVSHASFTHLLVNLVTFLSFGPQLARVFSTSKWKLWPLVVGAALFSSHTFLLLDRRRHGCMGLSGVTLSFVAFSANLYPEREIGFLFLGVLPVRMPAKMAMRALLVWSVLGIVLKRGNVCHAAHLGGLVYGMGYYQMWVHRILLQRIRRGFLGYVSMRGTK